MPSAISWDEIPRWHKRLPKRAGPCHSAVVLRRILRLGVILVVLAVLLGADYWEGAMIAQPLLAQIRNEVVGVFLSVETQWMAVGCLAAYLIGFAYLRNLARAPFPCPNPERARLGCLLGLMLGALVVYAWGYREGRTAAEMPVLIGGMMLGQGAGCWQAWRQRQGDQRGIIPLIVVGLVLLLALVVLCQPDSGRTLRYWGEIRWKGIWHNPNVFGMLMAVGLVLAMGLALAGSGQRGASKPGKLKPLDSDAPMETAANPATKEEKHSSIRGMMEAGKSEIRKLAFKLIPWLRAGFCLAACGLLAVGLAKSYSRGAWVGTFAGLAYLGWQAMRGAAIPGHARAVPGLRICRWWWRNWKPLAVIVGAVVVLGYWQFRDTEQPLMRRVFSVANPYDFSWRNRVATWEGALQMMAERPWLGLGWNQALAHYEAFYMPGRLLDGRALWSNDYFTLGLTLGLPALACFLGYVMLSLRSKCEVRSSNPNPDVRKSEIGNPKSEIAVVCRAGAIVLLVGFWFDGGFNGGLFKLATGATFWILLELGAGAGRATTAEDAPA